jgi:hypothetical protein
MQESIRRARIALDPAVSDQCALFAGQPAQAGEESENERDTDQE